MTDAKGFLAWGLGTMGVAGALMVAVHVWQGHEQAKPVPRVQRALLGSQVAQGRFEMLPSQPGDAYRIQFRNGPCAYRAKVPDADVYQAVEQAAVEHASYFDPATVKGTGTGKCISIESLVVNGEDLVAKYEPKPPR
jgi:hypothetical protein